MKNKLQLLFPIIIILVFNSILTFGQCTSNALYTNSPPGFYPDTIQNLPSSDLGANYNGVITVKTITDYTSGSYSFYILKLKILSIAG